MIETQSEVYQQLVEQGYCRIPQVLPDDLRKRLQSATDILLAQQTDEQAMRFRSQGSMFPTTSDPLFAELIALPKRSYACMNSAFRILLSQTVTSSASQDIARACSGIMTGLPGKMLVPMLPFHRRYS